MRPATCTHTYLAVELAILKSLALYYLVRYSTALRCHFSSRVHSIKLDAIVLGAL